ncbi:hypothetical protein C8F04DRAFT_1195841 [Mycena alexandri]|uniref:Ribonuclease H1 N-terminal domain-containing protein n=1 Tax=Mycena alexandri TaxID=1745969 RepID=A0AAD6WU64_9AGAR|nr:hypothetical protein C8F04DRAFT_1195841 [Mycena alexandri]
MLCMLRWPFSPEPLRWLPALLPPPPCPKLPCPKPPAVATLPGLVRTTAPWAAGILFGIVPPVPLTAVPDNGGKWFAITRGKYISLTQNSAISLNAVTGISTGLGEKFNSQSDTLSHFNGALALGALNVFLSIHRIARRYPKNFRAIQSGSSQRQAPLNMPSSHSPPPPYNVDDNVEHNVDDNDELIRLLAELELDPVSPQTASPVIPPRTPPPVPTTPVRSVNPVYSYRTPVKSGTTSSWAEASSETQGVSGASPRRLTPKSKPRTKKRGYAVFCGREIGALRHWDQEVLPLVNKVPSSLYQGYSTFAEAEAAFKYAQGCGWTRVIAPDGSFSSTIAAAPTPSASLQVPNPLHAGSAAHGSLCLECSLNTLGLSSSTYESCHSRETAESLFQAAVARHHVTPVVP